MFAEVIGDGPFLGIGHDRGQLPEFPCEDPEGLFPFEGQRVVFSRRSLARFDPLRLDKPFLGQTTEDRIDGPFRGIDVARSGDRPDQGVPIMTAPGQGPRIASSRMPLRN